MSDVFVPADAVRVLKGKRVLLMGDSIMRNLYKDLVWLCHTDKKGFTPRSHLIEKGESSYCGDHMFESVSKGTHGRDYRESREWFSGRRHGDIRISFVFITRCYDDRIRNKIVHYDREFGSYPDVIMINSAIWDINRWGPRGIQNFKRNIHSLMRQLKRYLPSRTQVIWMTTPPISVEIRGGFLIKQLEFQKESMRFNIMEGNQYAAVTTASYGFDVLDMHYVFKNQLHRRSKDGIHWNPDAVWMQACIFLSHLCISRDLPLPSGTPTVGTNQPLVEALRFGEKAREEVLRKARAASPAPSSSKGSSRQSRKYAKPVRRGRY